MLVYITCSGKKEAREISRKLLEKRVIACSNMFPIESMFWWKGKMDECSEYVIIAKAKNFEKVKAEVRKIHSYDVPAIIKIEAEMNEEYQKWVDKEIRD